MNEEKEAQKRTSIVIIINNIIIVINNIRETFNVRRKWIRKNSRFSILLPPGLIFITKPEQSDISFQFDCHSNFEHRDILGDIRQRKDGCLVLSRDRIAYLPPMDIHEVSDLSLAACGQEGGATIQSTQSPRFAQKQPQETSTQFPVTSTTST